jgi:hypothetical protein
MKPEKTRANCLSSRFTIDGGLKGRLQGTIA